MVTTTYNVIVEDSNHARAFASVTIFVINSAQCCLPPGFNNSPSNYNFSPIGTSQQVTITEILQRYPNLNSTITTNSIISINGTLLIVQDFEFLNCTAITMGPGALIDVLPGITLEIFESQIRSCREMSRGIRAESNSTVIIRGSHIYDCQYGVEARNGSNIESSGNSFIDNYVGIYFSPFNSSNPISVNAQILNTKFTSANTHLAHKYLGQLPLPLSKPLAGILMREVGFLSIDNNNEFTNLNYGIYAMNSNLDIKNCNFMNIRPFDNYSVGLNLPPPPNQVGWSYIFPGSAIFSIARSSAFMLNQIGRNDEHNPDFVNCKYGITNVSTGIISGFNYMVNCDFGYFVFGVKERDVVVTDNNIKFNKVGIVSVFNSGSNRLHWIMGNTLLGGLNSVALDGVANMPKGIIVNDISGYSSAEVKNNEITITPHVSSPGSTFREAGGIFLNGISYSDINHNTINLENNINTNICGVSLLSSYENEVTCNIVTGTRTFAPVNDPDIAMRFQSSKSNIISCNGVTNTSTGFKFVGNCKDGGDHPTDFRFNDIGYHNHGLLYTESARVDEQLNKGNRWLPTFNYNNNNGAAAKNKNSSYEGGFPVYQLDKYVKNLNSTPSLNQVDPTFWFQENFDLDENCDYNGIPLGNCISEIIHTGGTSENYSYLINIALDAIANSKYDEETRWSARVQLYEMLLKNPDYMGGNSELANFYANNAGTTIQTIAQLNVDRDKLFENQSSLLQIVEENAMLIYYKSQQIRFVDSLMEYGDLVDYDKDSLKNYKETLVQGIIAIVTFNNAAFRALESTISEKVDLLNALNETNIGIKVYEQNEEIINKIYLKSIAINEPENVFNHASNILNIASQCPLAGGNAVYRARVLYSIVNPEMDYNDELNCLQSGYLLRMSRNITGKSKLYPNPASDEVTLIYNVIDNSILHIMDGLGRIINIFQLNPNEISKTFKVSALESGMYLYRIVDNAGSMIDTGQFIVNK